MRVRQIGLAGLVAVLLIGSQGVVWAECGTCQVCIEKTILTIPRYICGVADNEDGYMCCTPETYRAFFKEVPSPAMGINYDPSHLLRMGIDPHRFLREFVGRVYHVHGKDTEIIDENRYEYGTEQPPTFAKQIPFGAIAWRYTIPGQGVTRWKEVMRTLTENGYQGCVCIELEDANFNGPADEEQFGTLQGARFLEGC